jgi:hypothetical protein
MQQLLILHLLQPLQGRLSTSTRLSANGAAASMAIRAEIAVGTLETPQPDNNFSRQISPFPNHDFATSSPVAAEAREEVSSSFSMPIQVVAVSLQPFLGQPAANALATLSARSKGDDRVDRAAARAPGADVHAPVATLGQLEASTDSGDICGSSRVLAALPPSPNDQVPATAEEASQVAGDKPSRYRRSLLRGLPRGICNDSSSSTAALACDGSDRGWLHGGM